MAKTETKPIEELSYEGAFAELEEIVAALESGEQPLEEALSLFERGQKLSKHCAELLTRAELKVQELSGETLAPFREGE
jgi:exodeoxyribonuclease VII small subunit